MDMFVNYETPATTNALAEQKDMLLAMFNKAEHVKEFRQAREWLKVLAPVWSHLGYGYKAREVARALKLAAEKTLAGEEYYLANCRKNDRHRQSTEAHKLALEEFIAELSAKPAEPEKKPIERMTIDELCADDR